jgi:vacuolar-type H+-ATPase subunit I/STV1
MNQNSSGSQGFGTPSRKRAAPHEDNDIQSPFDTSSQGPFTPNKRVKFEGSSSWLGQAWTPPSPATQPSGSQKTVTSTSGDDDESIEEIISRLDELPAYIKKLQRKKIAAEKSCEVKSRKIAELQKEVERLKAREQDLEEALAG